jgi:hypothetical protein
VEDTNPHSLSAHGWLEDTSKVAKYVMSDADYAARAGTYRAYKERRRQARRAGQGRVGCFNPILSMAAFSMGDAPRWGGCEGGVFERACRLSMPAFPTCDAPRRGVRGAAFSNAAAAAQEDPEWTAEKELCTRRGMPYAAAPARGAGADAAGPEHQAAEAAAIPVGARCEADPGAKRGVVRCARRAARRLHACRVLVAAPLTAALSVVPLSLGALRGRAWRSPDLGGTSWRVHQ